ncbi:MAG: CoA-binding protein [Flavobacteriales bacterium]|nr:CoA-binding protein [Flavobacteriales bacterium]
MSKSTLVIGASLKPYRYSHLAIQRLVNLGYPVFAVGRDIGEVHGITIRQEVDNFSDIHTVTLYLNADAQREYYESILALNPKRIIFNPGAENAEFKKRALESGIEAFNACNLVMLSANTF